MADKTVEGSKKVPPRNDFKTPALYKNSRALELQNRDPNFVYEFKSTDELHPHCLSKSGQLSQHEIGSQVGGYATVEAWEPVQKLTDARVAQVEARTDQGKPIDTLIRHGKQILCRLPKSEHAKYAAVDAAYNDSLEKNIYSPDRLGDGKAHMTAVVSKDATADQLQMLRAAGHAVPGLS